MPMWTHTLRGITWWLAAPRPGDGDVGFPGKAWRRIEGAIPTLRIVALGSGSDSDRLVSGLSFPDLSASSSPLSVISRVVGGKGNKNSPNRTSTLAVNCAPFVPDPTDSPQSRRIVYCACFVVCLSRFIQYCPDPGLSVWLSRSENVFTMKLFATDFK